MSNELTEQWLEGTLDAGWYYLEFENGTTLPAYYCGFNKEFELRWDWKISKVLAPYLSFADLCELKQDLEICREDRAELYSRLCKVLTQLEECKQKVHILNEANMKLENTVGKLCEQLQEANEVIESLRTYDFTVDDENAERYQVKWNVDAKRFYERHGVK